MSWLKKEALGHVLESLLRAELRQIRRRQSPLPPAPLGHSPWPDSMALGDEGSLALGCDSIERLWLSAAVNEMFCLYDTQTERNLESASTFGDWLDLLNTGWNAVGQRITFSTSGSSGVPKRCTHEMASLQRETAFWAEHLVGTHRIVAFAPSHHIYGFLFTAMLPSYLGVPVLTAGDLSPAALAAELRSGDLVISFPDRWEWLARSLPHWPAGVRGITSTAPCPEPLKVALAREGLESLTEIYGSSETAGIGFRTYPQTGYTLLPFWSWAGRNADTPELRDSTGHTITLQDRLDIAPDGTFSVRSRLDGAVQVGGTNVFPGQLEERLRALPGVAEAAVRLSAGTGPQRLKAFIVAAPGAGQPALAASLEQWAEELPAPERIRSFAFGPALPRNEMGKLTDWDA